jgi:hypothetical protein
MRLQAAVNQSLSVISVFLVLDSFRQNIKEVVYHCIELLFATSELECCKCEYFQFDATGSETLHVVHDSFSVLTFASKKAF